MLNKEHQRSAYVLREEHGLTWEKVGEHLGVSRKTAKRLYDRYTPTENPFPIERFRPLHIEGDAILSCDWHIPLHSPKMVNLLFEKAQEHEISTLIIAGDYFNQDAFGRFFPKQKEASWKTEREEATAIMDAALDIFDEVILSLGNHDERLIRLLEHTLSYEECVQWALAGIDSLKLERLTVTDLDHLMYHPGTTDIRICHQRNFSKRPLTVPRELADKYECSILTAHSHHFAQGVSFNGKYRLFEGGGLFDKNRTEYIQRTTTHHVWVQGFYCWKDGICHPYSPLYHNL